MKRKQIECGFKLKGIDPDTAADNDPGGWTFAGYFSARDMLDHHLQ